MQCIIRITVVVVGVVGTAITFFTNSTLVLWILGADVSYTLIFPQLVAVLFFRVTNGYGATVGYVVGLAVRILLGENAVGLPVILQLPGCILEDGVYVQKAPVRAAAMLCTLVTILVFSALVSFMFNRGLLPESWDIYRVKHNRTESDTGCAATDTECEEDTHGIPLQPMLPTGS